MSLLGKPLLVTLFFSMLLDTMHAVAQDVPAELFKDLSDEIVGDAILLSGKQLFVDDYIIEDITRARKVLNQPVKHPRNPIIVPENPWEKTLLNRGSVLYDKEDRIFKIWCIVYSDDLKTQLLCYATSTDDIDWSSAGSCKPSCDLWASKVSSSCRNVGLSNSPSLGWPDTVATVKTTKNNRLQRGAALPYHDQPHVKKAG